MKGIIDFQAERYREITPKVDEVVELIKVHGAPEGLGPEHCIVTYALNKLKEEIAAMEKPEYEYVKLDGDFGDVIKALVDGETVYSSNGNGSMGFDGSEFFNHKGQAVDINCLSSHEFYRRVELTPEVKREREVEELARILHKIEAAHDVELKDIWSSLGDGGQKGFFAMAEYITDNYTRMESKK